jgi:hypothetical protein
MPFFQINPQIVEAFQCRGIMVDAKYNWYSMPEWIRDLYENGGVVFTDEGIHLPIGGKTVIAKPDDFIVPSQDGRIQVIGRELFLSICKPCPKPPNVRDHRAGEEKP